MFSPVQFDLAPGERLLWAGAPRQGVVFAAADIFRVPFSVLWGGFAISWEIMVIRSHGPIFMQLWGIPFVLIGLYIMVGRFLADAWRRANTTYGVTTDRVVIAVASPMPSLKSIALRYLSDFTLNQRSDGSGTIMFGVSPDFSRFSTGLGWRRLAPGAAFEMIPDAQAVYDKIREAQSALASTTASPR